MVTRPPPVAEREKQELKCGKLKWKTGTEDVSREENGEHWIGALYRRERGRRGDCQQWRGHTFDFNMTLARSRMMASGTFVGRICAKRPFISSAPGSSDSPKPRNFPFATADYGQELCFCPVCDSPISTTNSRR